jgi:hypothetical protein
MDSHSSRCPLVRCPLTHCLGDSYGVFTALRLAFIFWMVYPFLYFMSAEHKREGTE